MYGPGARSANFQPLDARKTRLPPFLPPPRPMHALRSSAQGAALDGPQPRDPQNPAAWEDRPPVRREAAQTLRVGREHARLCRQAGRRAARSRLDAEVHHRFDQARCRRPRRTTPDRIDRWPAAAPRAPRRWCRERPRCRSSPSRRKPVRRGDGQNRLVRRRIEDAFGPLRPSRRIAVKVWNSEISPAVTSLTAGHTRSAARIDRRL